MSKVRAETMSESSPQEHVAIVGAGLMGAQIGCEYALAGCPVSWIVRDAERASRRVEAALQLAVEHRLADAKQVAAARRRMEYLDGRSRDRAPAQRGDSPLARPLALIVESLPEDLGVKAEVLQPLAKRYPEAIFATNTSSISIGELGQAAWVAQRIVGTHYWNPPLLMPLVEVLAGADTPKAVREIVVTLLRRIGKRPVVLEREAQGLLWNRLQLAVLREALWLVEKGIATPQTIDEVMRDGLARRWRLTGPFETVGLGGAATFDAIAANLFPSLSDATQGSGFDPHVPHDRELLAALRKRRDEALAAELQAERERPGI